MCFWFLFGLQRKNLTIAFTAAESIGIKATLVSTQYWLLLPNRLAEL